MAEDYQRRLPSTERQINEIKAGDIRVSIIGTVVDRNEEGTSLVLDDGTGRIIVSLETPTKSEAGKPARVFGRVIPMEKGFEIQGEIFQSMEGVDFGLLKKIKGLKM